MRKLLFYMAGMAVFVATGIGCDQNEFWTLSVVNQTQHVLHVVPRTDDEVILFLKPGASSTVFSGTSTSVSLIALYAPGQNVEGLAESSFSNPQEPEVIFSCGEEKTVAGPKETDIVWEIKAENLR